MESVTWGLIIVIACLSTSAFFSLTETAVTSISNLKAKHMREHGGKAAQILDLWLHSPHRVLASILIGNNLINIFAAVLVDDILRSHFGASSVFVVSGIMTTVIVLFAEIIPKTLAKTYAQQVAVPALNIYRFFYWILLPSAIVLTYISNFITSLTIKRSTKIPPQITEEELEFLIDIGEEEGVLEEQKHEMLSGIFELGDTVVREIMVHRTDMTAIPHATKIIDAIDFFKDTGLSRIPIYEERIDNVIGILHVKDALFFLKRHHEDERYWSATVAEIKREAIFVPETKPIDHVFQEIRKSRQHMAIVLDEYGGTSGVVTMEDIFEEIVGEVRDEFDKEEDAIRPTHVAHQFLVDCKIHIDDFCDFFDISMPNMEKDSPYEYDTLAGLILHHFGHIPKCGDTLTIVGVKIEVAEVSKRRVRRVLAYAPENSLVNKQVHAKMNEPTIADKDPQTGKNMTLK